MSTNNDQVVSVYDMTHADEVMRPVNGDRAPTLNARMGTGGNQVPVLAFDTTQITSKENGSKPEYGKPCHPLCSTAHAPAVVIAGNKVDHHAVFTQQSFSEYSETGKASAIKQRDYKYATDLVVRQKSIRRLTPTECERLQGLPDGYTDIDGASDTARYKALGNGMAQPCADYILRRLMEVIDDGG